MTSQYLRFTVYTDGGADPNPGSGGWAAIIFDNSTNQSRELFGSEPDTTNNRMELTAAIRALESLSSKSEVTVVTDSEYVRRGITEWIVRWRASGWTRKDGPIQNIDLWRQLAQLTDLHTVSWEWVKGHAGNQFNERADELATSAIRSATQHGTSQSKAEVDIYIRVSCVNSRGGWAAMIRQNGEDETISGHLTPATSNQLDLIAASKALERVVAGRTVRIWTGSDYLRNGALTWLSGWKNYGWKTKAGAPVKNMEAWKRLSNALENLSVEWPSVKGKDVPEFNHLDKLARREAG